MRIKAFMIPFVAVLVIFMVGLVSAGDLSSGISTRFNDVALDSSVVTMAGATGEVVPVRVTFNALEDAEDVRVKVWMEGH